MNSLNYDLIYYLVQLGIDIHIKDSHGRTAFIECINIHLECIYKNKIQFPFDLSSRDHNGCTLISCISFQATDMERLVQILLENGADINAVDKCGRSALHHSVISENYQSIKNKAELISILLHSGSNIEIKDIFGKTAYQYKTCMNHTDQMLLKYYLFERSILYNHETAVPGSFLGNYQKTKAKIQSLGQFKRKHVSITFSTNVLKKLSDESVRKILQTKGVGIVDGLTEFREIQEQVDLLVNRIAEKLSSNGSPFKFRAKLSGGVSEHCKVGLPDEFNYLLFVDGLEKFFEIDLSDKSGWAILRKKGKRKLVLESVASRNDCFDDNNVNHDKQEKFCNRFVNEYGFMEPMIFAIFFTRMIYESLRDGSV